MLILLTNLRSMEPSQFTALLLTRSQQEPFKNKTFFEILVCSQLTIKRETQAAIVALLENLPVNELNKLLPTIVQIAAQGNQTIAIIFTDWLDKQLNKLSLQEINNIFSTPENVQCVQQAFDLLVNCDMTQEFPLLNLLVARLPVKLLTMVLTIDNFKGCLQAAAKGFTEILDEIVIRLPENDIINLCQTCTYKNYSSFQYIFEIAKTSRFTSPYEFLLTYRVSKNTLVEQLKENQFYAKKLELLSWCKNFISGANSTNFELTTKLPQAISEFFLEISKVCADIYVFIVTQFENHKHYEMAKRVLELAIANNLEDKYSKKAKQLYKKYEPVQNKTSPMLEKPVVNNLQNPTAVLGNMTDSMQNMAFFSPPQPQNKTLENKTLVSNNTSLDQTISHANRKNLFNC